MLVPSLALPKSPSPAQALVPILRALCAQGMLMLVRQISIDFVPVLPHVILDHQSRGPSIRTRITTCFLPLSQVLVQLLNHLLLGTGGGSGIQDMLLDGNKAAACLEAGFTVGAAIFIRSLIPMTPIVRPPLPRLLLASYHYYHMFCVLT